MLHLSHVIIKNGSWLAPLCKNRSLLVRQIALFSVMHCSIQVQSRKQGSLACKAFINRILCSNHQRCLFANSTDFAYTIEFQESIAEKTREKFWAKQAEAISWFHKPTSDILSFSGENQLPIRPQWSVVSTRVGLF